MEHPIPVFRPFSNGRSNRICPPVQLHATSFLSIQSCKEVLVTDKTKDAFEKFKEASHRSTSPRRKRYSSAQKTALLSKYRELRKSGMGLVRAAHQVGVSYQTLRKWEKEAGLATIGRRGAGKSAKDKLVRTGAPKANGGIVLTTPQGFRIEGLSLNDLIQVLQAVK